MYYDIMYVHNSDHFNDNELSDQAHVLSSGCDTCLLDFK